MASDDDFLDDDDYEADESTDDVDAPVQLTPRERADARRKVEARLEELRLKRIMDDYNFDLD